jgi:hypothetical protein
MIKLKKIFDVDKNLEEKIRSKYAKIKVDVTDFCLGTCNIQIESRIFKECLKISEEETKKLFRGLCIAFLKTCHDNKIPCRPLNLLVLTDDEIDRALSNFWIEDDNSLKGFILIPARFLTLPDILWGYNFLHELGHCWISIESPTDKSYLSDYEMFVDLVAICSLGKIIPSHNRLFKDTVRNLSYLGSVGREYYGKKGYKEVLKNPELFLKRSMEYIKSLF